MDTRSGGWLQPRALVYAALAATAAALAARELGLPATAVAVALASGLSLAAGRAGPWLLAAPAALAATTLPAPPVAWPRPGPVRIDAVVGSDVRVDPGRGETWLALRDRRSGAPFACVLRSAEDVLPGDRLAGVVRLAAQEQRQRDGRMPLVTAETDALRITAGAPSFARTTVALRLRLQKALLAAIPGEPGALLCHLVLGQGPQLRDDLTAAHRASGLSHLLAVSGAHASMLMVLCALTFGWLTGRAPLSSPRYRLGCALFLLLYGGITGMQPPVVRAIVAFGLVLWAHPQGRRVTVTAALALPALVTAVLAPDDVGSASFCLSYAAVFGLALAGPVRPSSSSERWLWLPVRASVWATITTAPLTLWWFGQLAPWTIVATPLLAPLVAILLAGGLLVATAGCLAPAVAHGLGAPLGGLAELYALAVRGFACLPGAPILAWSTPSPLLLVGFAALGAAALAWRPGRAGVALLSLALVVPWFLPALGRPPALQMLAVGHGQACLAWLPDGRTVLIDCGSLGDGHRAARAVVAALRRRRIDLLVVTHADADHVDGIAPLLQQVPITSAALPAELLWTPLGRRLCAAGCKVRLIARGDLRTLGEGLQVWRPPAPDFDSNDSCVWTRLQWRSFSAVLPGDAMEAGVDAWLHGPACEPATVLVLPHHGRAHSRAQELLAAVRPTLALISDGAGKEPVQSVTARALGITVLRTGERGTVTIAPDLVIGTEAAARLPR